MEKNNIMEEVKLTVPAAERVMAEKHFAAENTPETHNLSLLWRL